MKNSYPLLLIALWGAAISCGQDKNRPEGNDPVAIALPFLDDGGLKMSDVADSISYIRLETSPECLIGQIDRLIPLDTALVVVDKEIAQGVYLFGRDGRFIRRIATRGEGPGEYAAIEDVTVDRERGQVVLLDLDTQHFLVYGLDGTWIKSVPFDFYAYGIEALGGGRITGFLSLGSNKKLEKDGLVPTAAIYDLDGKKIEGLYAYANKDIHSSSILNCAFNIADDGRRTRLFVPLNDTVYSVARQGIVPEYTLDFGPGQKQLQREYTDYVAQNRPDAMTGPKRAEEMGLAQLSALVFTERNDLFSYRKGGDAYLAVRNRASGHIKSLRVKDMASLMSDMDHITLMIPYGADSERMYMMVNPYALAELPAEKQNERTRALKAEYSQDDNPVIAVIRMKDF